MPNKSDSNNDNTYKANRTKDTNGTGSNKNQANESNKKVAKMASKIAANHYAPGIGGKVVDKLANTKLGNAALNKMGKSFGKQNPGLSKVANKLDNVGMLDKADKLVDLKNGNKPNDVNNKQPSTNKNNDLFNKLNKVSNFANKINKVKKSMSNEEETGENSEQKKEGFLKSTGLDAKIKTWIIKNPSIAIPIFLVLLVVIVMSCFLLIILSSSSDGNGNIPSEEESDSTTTTCSTISLKSTSLSQTDFVSKLQSKAKSDSRYQTFASQADTIYKISVNNNTNPEMIMIRAAVEGFSPGASRNNYWGLGCTNTGGINACITYSSFSNGVLGYINNISKYATIEDMMSKYAYIGAYWYSPGGSGMGGCYYYPYIKKYMSSERASIVGNACSKSCSGTSCLATTTEDQKAYTSYQVEKMVAVRSSIFGLGQDSCDSSSSGSANGDGSKIASYAESTYDSYSYSQSLRMSVGYVDCSSMVYRTYKHFNIDFGASNTAAGEYTWCSNHKKLISESNLQAGDLIFFGSGSHYNASRAGGVGHVSIYVGNGKQFAARSSTYAQPDQVAETSYLKGSGTYFCRPYK